MKLPATTTSTNQNIWIEEMNKVLGNYPGINVVGTVYGDDLADKSYREANGLMQPIILCEDKILDGCNRYRACRKLEIEPRFTTFDGGDPWA